MAIGGWVKIYRQMTEWGWYRDVPTKTLFLHCLLRANVNDVEVFGHKIPRGAFVTSRDNLASETGLSVQQVRTALKKLQKTGELEVTATNKCTIVKVVKFSDFQSYDGPEQPSSNQHNSTLQSGFDSINAEKSTSNQPAVNTSANGKTASLILNSNQQATINQPSSNHQVTTVQEYKELKKNKNTNTVHAAEADAHGVDFPVFEEIWKLYPSKRGKGAVSKKSKAAIEKVGREEMARALARYRAEVESANFNQQWMNGSTFFNGRYVDYLDANYTPKAPLPSRTDRAAPGGRPYSTVRMVGSQGPRKLSDLEE